MINPAPGYILAEQYEEDTSITSSGLYRPETAKDKPIKSKVISVGGILKDGDKTWYPPNLSAGDIFYHQKWATQDFEEDGKKLKFVKFSDVMGIWQNS